MNKQICEMVNEVVCNALLQGVIPWKEPEFISEPAVNAQGRPYSMVNQWLLGKSGTWLSFKQVEAAKGRVIKGEKSKFVIFWTMWVKYKLDEKGEKVLDKDGNPIVENKIPVLKYYRVFHESQCEGLKLKKLEKNVEVNKEGEELIGLYRKANPDLQFEISRDCVPCYNVNTDVITLPPIDKYVKKEDFYAAAFHEIIHSTGHQSRLNRLNSKETAAFSSEASKEELVAEIGSAVLMNKCGIETEESQEASTAYIQKWLEALKHDETMIVTAAGRAEKAVDYVLASF